MNKKLVSIIMPAYNAADYIEESITSVQQQTYTNWELIIIDDGSEDDTATIASRYGSDKRIKYHYQTNKKLPAARNGGLRVAQGEYIAFLDSDDLWIANKLEEQIKVLDSQKVDVVFSNGYIFSEKMENRYDYPTTSGLFAGREMYKMQYEKNYIPVLSVIFRRECIDEIGFQDESLIYGWEDWDYWTRMARSNKTFLGMQEKFFYYRRHANNMSKNKVQMSFAKATVFLKNFDPACFNNKETIKLYKTTARLLTEGLFEDEQRKASKLLFGDLRKFNLPFLYYCNLSITILLGKYSSIPIRGINKLYGFIF